MKNFIFITSDIERNRFSLFKFLKNNKNYRIIPLNHLEAYVVSFSYLPQDVSAIDSIISLREFIKEKKIKLLGWPGFRYFTEEDIRFLNKNLGVSVTSGISLLVWSIFECVYRFLRIRKLNLKELKVGVMDIEEPVMILLLKKLVELFSNIILISKDKNLAERIKYLLLDYTPNLKIDIQTEPKDLELIILYDLESKFFFTNDFFIFYLKGRPKNTNLNQNFIRVGLIKLPFCINIGFFKNLPNNLVPAELAEVVILAKENNFSNYSWNQTTNPDKLEEIADLLAKNNFEVWAPYAPIN